MDLFRIPGIGPLARWRYTRRIAQGVLLAAAVLVVWHGLFGPQIAPRNAATVFTWVHYRGLLVIGLLALGNLFCTACPMVLVRDAARRVRAPRRSWPRRLRGKWLAVVLFAAVLFTYELFDLWSLPRATAWLVLGYFGAALTVDLVFSGAAFCKYVCPVGQFNFAASLLSPAELRVRSVETCRSCHTADCIKGRPDGARRGCELGLFLPMKVGNMDCTLCLDCVGACPHDNIGFMTRVPGAELLETGRRSGVGRLTQRPDLAALAVLFTFGALLNAFAMTAPSARLEAGVADALPAAPDGVALASVFVAALVALPLALLPAASGVARALAGPGGLPMRATALRYAFALVPLGFAVWLAHYGFHFLTGVLTAAPVLQSAAIDAVGWAALGEPLWRWAGMSPGSVFPIQIGLVVLGAAGSAGIAHGMSQYDYPDRAWLTASPWIALIAALAWAAIWIVAQPMAMRGVGGIG